MITVRKTRSARLLTQLMTLLLCALMATPAAAWKPKTHIYLAEQARLDAIDDGKVTIYETDYESGKILAPLGAFEVNPAVLDALRKKPNQFRAGVVGPDAYPDILTGQQLIHPGTNKSLLGDPATGELPSAAGSDAWLTHLWRKAYALLTLAYAGAVLTKNPSAFFQEHDGAVVREDVASENADRQAGGGGIQRSLHDTGKRRARQQEEVAIAEALGLRH